MRRPSPSPAIPECPGPPAMERVPDAGARPGTAEPGPTEGLEGDLVRALPRLARRFARDGSGPAGVETEDLVQEVALRALRHRERFDPRRPAWPWLARIARRVRADHYARADRRDGELHEEVPGPQPEVGARIAQREELERALATLRPLEREVLLRFHRGGEPVAHIAATLDLPEGTVKSHLHRARRRLAGGAPPPADAPRTGADHGH